MKTPIQKLIDRWEGLKEEVSEDLRPFISHIIIEGLKDMLEEEKNAIECAFEIGTYRGRENSNQMGFQYYIETFDTKDE